MKRMIAMTALIAGAALTAPAFAGDFSEGSTAKSWNLTGQENAIFEARVTDAVCALTGDCPDDCGAGKRTMVLIRAADDKTILVSKNVQTGFQGPTWDLAKYCNQTVTVDGLMVGDDPKLASKLYQVQKIKAGDGEWAKANGFSDPWKARNPNAGGKGPWFRRDPQIAKRLESTGYLGLGQEADDAFIADEY